MKWLVGSFVPAAVVILITPFFIRMYLKQSNMDLEHTRIYSERMSGQMNAMTKNERVNIYII